MPSKAVVRGELDLDSRKFEAGISRAQRQIKTLESTARRLGTLSFFAGGAAIVSTTRTIIDFQREMSKTGALVDANAEQFAELTSKARELGSTTMFSASEAASGFAFLAQAGFESNEILESSGDFLNLAAAGSLDLATTMDIASNIMQGFGLEAQSSGRAVDVLSNIAASSNTNVLDLGEAMKQIGPVAAAGSVEIESAAAAVGLLANAGIKGSLSGTSLRNIILRLSDPTSEAKKAIAALGLTVEQLNPATNSMVEIFGSIKSGMDGASDSAMALGAASDIFGLRAAASGLVLTNNVDELERLTAANVAAEGTTQRLADRIQDNLGGSLKILQSRFAEVQIAIGEGGFDESLRKVMDEASAALESFVSSGGAEELGESLGNGLRTVVEAFKDFVDAAKSAAQFAGENEKAIRGLMGALLGLYAGIKSIQLAGFIGGLAKTAVGLASSTAGLFSNTSALAANTAATTANAAAKTALSAAEARYIASTKPLYIATTGISAAQRDAAKAAYGLAEANGLVRRSLPTKEATRFLKVSRLGALAVGGLGVGAAVTAGLMIKAAYDIREANAALDDLATSTKDVNDALEQSRGDFDSPAEKAEAVNNLLKKQKAIQKDIKNKVDDTEAGRNLQEAQLKAIGRELDRHNGIESEIAKKSRREGASSERKKALIEEQELLKKNLKISQALQDSAPLARIHDIQAEITREINRQKEALESSPSLNQENQIAALEERRRALGQLTDARKELNSVVGEFSLGDNFTREIENTLQEIAGLRLKKDFAAADDLAEDLEESVLGAIERSNPDWDFLRAQAGAAKVLDTAREINRIATSNQLVGPDEVTRAARVLDIVQRIGGDDKGGARRALAEDLLDIEEKRSELSDKALATQLKKEEEASRLAKEEMELLRAQAGLGGDAEAIKLRQEEFNLAREIAETQGIAGQAAYTQAEEKLRLERQITEQKEAQAEADKKAKKAADIAEKSIRAQASEIQAMLDRLDDRATALPSEISRNNGNRSIKGAARNDIRRGQQVEIAALQSQANVAASKLKELKNSTSSTNVEIQAAERELRNLADSLSAAAGAARKSDTGGTAVKGNRPSLTGRATGRGAKLIGGEGKRVRQAQLALVAARKKELERSKREAEAQAKAESDALKTKQEKQAEIQAKESAALEQKSKDDQTRKRGEKTAREVSVTVDSSGSDSFTAAAKSICDCINELGEKLIKSAAHKSAVTAANDLEKIREYFDELSVN